MNSKRYLTVFVMLGWGLALPATADVEAECRGVAAGVVAALRASGEVSGDAAVEAAVLGARRGCEAAMMTGSISGGPSGGDGPATAAKAEDEDSFWNIFGDGDDEDDGDPASDNPGIDRLKRLRN
jgi:hypothetical protein